MRRYKINKYSAQRSNGFASKLESAVYDMLKLLERAGEITDLRCQDCVSLTKADIRSKIDFSFIRKSTGLKEYAEAKGAETERWRIIRKLWEFYGPGELSIWKGDYRRPTLSEVIKPGHE